ncbi:MAG: hypothetical protein QG635_1787 [Bacteroidota bacterium]|nr:hypothetical protein [Bacteroidota bacterium]
MNKELENRREIDYSWNFESANTKEYSHCYHSYPAMMIPQIARRLISEFKNSNTKLLFDPYCGTGTSLLEANLSGINAIGTDLNPLARLIARVKTKLYDINIISKYINKLENEIHDYQLSNSENLNLFSIQKVDKNNNNIDAYQIPEFPNINFWFSDKIIQKLAFLKDIIEKNIDIEFRDFFLIPFSETVRESSFTRNSEFKLFRIPMSKMKEFNPNPFSIYFSKVKRNFSGLKALEINFKPNTYAKVYDFNTCNAIPMDLLQHGSIDLTVTSPPYGDSKTTVAYGQFSRLSNQWLGFDNSSQIDNILMGGNGSYKKGYLEFESAVEELHLLKTLDLKRYNDVQSFLIDYNNSINNISVLYRKGAYICYVLGNRTVKNIQIPLDLITVEIFCKLGFEHIKTIIRNIPNKRMPKSNSPTNKIGITSSTMNNEYIVILKKL